MRVLDPSVASRAATDGALLSFVAAFVDTCGFVALFGLFTAHVTGNFVLMGAAFVEQRGDVLAKLLAFPVFVLAVALAVLLAHAAQRRGWHALRCLLGVEAGLLLLAAALAQSLPAPRGPDDPSSLLIGMTLVLAMGLQNALMRLALPHLPPTTVMTGNVTQITLEWVQRRLQPGAAEGPKPSRLLPALLGFFAGAAGGAVGYRGLGFACLLLPALACGGLCLRSRAG